MMKLAYERPVMRAEAFATNAYCSACGGQVSFLDGALSLAKDLVSGWFTIGFLGGYRDTTPKDVWTGLTFQQDSRRDMTSQANGFEGQKQYYWTATAEDTKYYLEYSVERSNNRNADVFVLYEEQTGNQNLDINWKGYTGTETDNYSTTYDDSLVAVQFNERVVQDS